MMIQWGDERQASHTILLHSIPHPISNNLLSIIPSQVCLQQRYTAYQENVRPRTYEYDMSLRMITDTQDSDSYDVCVETTISGAFTNLFACLG